MEGEVKKWDDMGKVEREEFANQDHCHLKEILLFHSNIDLDELISRHSIQELFTAFNHYQEEE